MAYINVAEWSVENVVDWLKGKRFRQIISAKEQNWEVALSDERSFLSHPIFGCK